MFHFICREAVLNMTKWWSHDFACNHSLGLLDGDSARSLDLITVVADFALAVGSLVVVTVIMFLQLIFLIVSVWLFCKCWFISWSAELFSINFKNKYGKQQDVTSTTTI
jgi:hypothetical protein